MYNKLERRRHPLVCYYLTLIHLPLCLQNISYEKNMLHVNTVFIIE